MVSSCQKLKGANAQLRVGGRGRNSEGRASCKAGNEATERKRPSSTSVNITSSGFLLKGPMLTAKQSSRDPMYYALCVQVGMSPACQVHWLGRDSSHNSRYWYPCRAAALALDVDGVEEVLAVSLLLGYRALPLGHS